MDQQEPTDPVEQVVAGDVSAPADQQADLRPMLDAPLRIDSADPPGGAPGRLAGSLPDFPSITWEDFERASVRAQHGRATM